MPGFALGCGAGFKPFWPLGLAQRAPPAIILQALRRLRGAVLFRGLRPSSIQWFLFWLLGLTVQSSRPAFGGRLTFGVSLSRIRLPTAQVMCPSAAVTHSQVLPLVFSRSAGLRLLGSGPFGSCLVTGRRLWSHLARAVSLGGCVVFHPAGSNPAVKLTRQRRAAYFVR